VTATEERTTLCDLLRRNAEEHGESPALSWRDGDTWRTLSWREHRERVLEVAAGLSLLGVGASEGEYVAIMAANRPEHVIAALGVVHAGAGSSTFYSSLALEQIRYLAQNCGARVVILENGVLLERWLAIRAELPRLRWIVLIEGAEAFAHVEGVISLDELRRRGRGEPELRERWRRVRPEDHATLIYTSGTTGPPKGVPLTHRNCVWESATLAELAELPPGISTVSYLPLAHIAEQMLSIHMPLQLAAQVYFCPDAGQALDYVRQARPVGFFGVPRVWEKLRAGILARIDAASRPQRVLAHAALDARLQLVRLEQRRAAVPLSLRLRAGILERLVLRRIRAAIGLDRCHFTASSAAPLAIEVAEFFAALGLPILEVWGMTETSGVATGSRRDRIKIGSVGPPLAGVEVKLLEDGELLVRGPNCTAGYLNLPEATAELIDAEGWTHTGDIGVRDSDGFFRIVDRKKELIITAGGKNISPANIEGALKEHPLVGQALVFGDRRPYLVALVVLDGEVARGWARQQGIEANDVGVLARNPRVVEELERVVSAANARLSRVEQVKKIRVLPTEWTADSEELTPTMKLRRRVIHDKYREEIEALYR
jgi:long-chain acyl-CoA synthetase